MSRKKKPWYELSLSEDEAFTLEAMTTYAAMKHLHMTTPPGAEYNERREVSGQLLSALELQLELLEAGHIKVLANKMMSLNAKMIEEHVKKIRLEDGESERQQQTGD